MPKNKKITLKSLLRTLERVPYFALKNDEKLFLSKTIGQYIEAWSFITHPEVIRFIQSEYQYREINRYFITIETLRSKIYDSISEFLSSFKVNVNSYFTGGTADFICDVQLSDEAFSEFYKKLIEALDKASAGDALGDSKDRVTVFKVRDSLILSRKNISTIKKPEPDIIKKLLPKFDHFEILLRNYRSKEALKIFGNEDNINKYLVKLQRQNIILGYKIIFDFSRGIDRQYVPLCQATKQVPNILKHTRKELSTFLNPVIELLDVNPQITTDQTDKEVTHICINEYDAPMQRREWRKLFYEYAGNSVNMFSYPLEGTLNETPVILSDLPELLNNIPPYKSGGIEIGDLYHPLLNQGNKINLPMDGLLYHGVTLGDSNVGKTTTDIVISTSLIGKVKNIIILDNSNSFRAKTKYLPKSVVSDTNAFLQLDPTGTKEKAEEIIKSAMKLGNFRIIESPSNSSYCTLLEAICDYIQQQPDETKDGAPRRISNFLMIEEVNDAFGSNSERKNRIIKFIQMLTKASRKGWCVWLSTQKPSFLGYDDKSMLEVLNLLHNKVIHKVSDTKERDTIIDSLSLINTLDKTKINRYVEKILPYHAVVRATKNNGNQSEPLAPIPVHIIEPHIE